MADCPGPAVVLTTSMLPARPPAELAQAAPTVSWAPEVPLAELSLEQQDEEMIDVPVDQDEMALMGAIEAGMRTRVPILQAAGPSTRGLTMSFHALAMQKPSRLPRGCKPPLKIEDMEPVDFPASEFTQLLFMSPIVVPMPAAQFDVVCLATDLPTPAQYHSMMVEAAKTAAASKGKQWVVPTKEDDNNYGQLSSEAEEEEEEGKMPAQHFQCVQQNKKLAKKKANRAQAAAALAHRAQNDFSGCIPDGLGVKIWGPLDVERLNSCFCGALGPSFYYLYRTNAVFVGADANCVAAYEFGSGHAADTLQTMVYKFARRGFPCTPYELERLHKYYVNDERLQHLSVYGTPPAIPNWDGWQEISEENRYCLLFKCADKVAAQIDTEGIGLYYYIGMDPNVGQLWKQTPAHSTMPVIGPAINVTLTDSIMVDATAAGGPSTPPPKTKSTPQPPATNITQPEVATTTETGGAQATTGTG
ncbi:hypothetical protein C0992_010305 [Termitomyces sp. T32_za158]|nr:hypothetical protein C0992_010305 [Termitomyces sp. T32_za158]